MTSPRRFGECFEMSRDWPGTPEQEAAVRAALTPVFGSNFHKLLQRIDRRINQDGRRYLPVAFVPLAVLGRGFATGILLSDLLSTQPGVISGLVRHELGHTFEQLDLLAQSDKTRFMELVTSPGQVVGHWWEHDESFADAFRDWIDSDGTSWSELTPILIP